MCLVHEQDEKVEIDVEDGRYADPAFWLSVDAPCITLRLSDPTGGGAAYPSDVRLEVSQYGEFVGFGAYMGLHCLGWVWDKAEMTEFFRTALTCAVTPDAPASKLPMKLALYDINQGPDSPSDHSGVEVDIRGRTARVQIGHHVFGEAKGPAVAEFFRRAWLRATLKPEAKAA